MVITFRSHILAAMCGAALTLAACSPGSTSGGKAVTPSGSTLTSDQVAKAGRVTLTMTDFETAGGLETALDQLIKNFEARYPNITIKRSSKDFDGYGKTINLAMSADSPPDLAEANVPMAGKLIPSGLTASLDRYYAGYGWERRYPSSVLQLLRSDNGKTFGTGHFWGQAIGGNMVGVYYNKRALSELGLKVPSTFDEFQDALDVIRRKGKLPIQMGNLEQYPANHVLSTVLPEFSDPRPVRSWINGTAGTTFDTDGNKAALQTLADWGKKGYLPAQANGTRDDDAAAAFGRGEGVFDITGSWRSVLFAKSLGDNAGFFTLPPRASGAVGHPTGWLANPFVISSKSKHADIAAFFLDYLSSPANSTITTAAGYLPFDQNAPAPAGAVNGEVVAAWKNAVRNDSLVPYLDFAAPAMGNAMFPALQSLIAGKLQPGQVAKTVQSTWADYHS
ncbi:ABC transporter substrate-binding protein [Actinomadura roseirufa]|uniref:ABC transporter substrate-binding protein n=1 Tax=Actinomadura roseirufa TaxID=2094049 RepID=UPI0010419A1E|nr:extracellular solute-binding protein [Actinomadura roseirufa]